jgi:hypothetical protein
MAAKNAIPSEYHIAIMKTGLTDKSNTSEPRKG